MMQNLLKEKLIEYGADLVGFSCIETCPIKNQNLCYAITVAVKINDAVLKTIESKPTIEYFQQYRAVNALLDQITLKGARFIERQGYNAFPIAASQSTADDTSSYRAVFSQ